MSNKNPQLVANAREQFGKGAARKLRAAGETPAVIYGHGTDPVHVSVDAHAISLIVRRPNALIELDLAGKDQLVLVKDVQRDPVRQIIEHIDLIIVRKGELVEVEVPVIIEGTPFSGTNALLELGTIRLSVPADAIPESIVVDVEGQEAGTQTLVSDLNLPDGATALDEEDQLVVHVLAQVVQDEGTTEDAEGAETADAPAEEEAAASED